MNAISYYHEKWSNYFMDVPSNCFAIASTWQSSTETIRIKILMHGILISASPKRLTDLSTQTLLTHWGRVTHICVVKLIILGSDNGLSPGRRQAIIWTNAGILLIGPLGTNFSEILIGIQTCPFKKMHLKMSSAKWRLLCLGLNELNKTIKR